MKTSYEILFRRIGLLFYAAVAVEKSMKIEDYDRLKNIINAVWKNDGVQDRPLHDALKASMLDSVREAFRSSMRAGEAMQLFTVYYTIHALAFDTALKNNIVSTYRQIVAAFSSTHIDKSRTDELKKLLAVVNDETKIGSL